MFSLFISVPNRLPILVEPTSFLSASPICPAPAWDIHLSFFLTSPLPPRSILSPSTTLSRTHTQVFHTPYWVISLFSTHTHTHTHIYIAHKHTPHTHTHTQISYAPYWEKKLITKHTHTHTHPTRSEDQKTEPTTQTTLAYALSFFKT